ncbi:MAG: DUF4166 domain-containing protein [Alphaproteobacteria bacterium]|nr:DUF4166 domain-containing protein [Alphaproteobacteria bacterium]
MAFALTNVLWSGPRAVEDEDHDHSGTIARIVGARAWASLPEAVRARFSRTAPAIYEGAATTQLTWAGRAFAWALLPFGSPLPLFAGEARATVRVGVKHGGTSWAREYRGPFGLAFEVRSTKRLSEDGRLFECCAGGWTMLLDVSADHGSLVFRSRRFFWRMGGVSIELPIWLTPGIAEVRHTDMGEGRFRFTLSFDHPWLGRTVFQDGVFEDPVR